MGFHEGDLVRVLSTFSGGLLVGSVSTITAVCEGAEFPFELGFSGKLYGANELGLVE